MEPLLWLGATSPGGLALPDAHPTPSQMYGPRGVFMDDKLLVVADSGNHRILIWHNLPDHDGQPADVVLCQPDFFTEGTNASGRGAQNGLHLPTGVGVWGGRLYVADAWHHRVLVWNEVPQKNDTSPDYALGQPDLDLIEPNSGNAISASGMYWPYGLGYCGGRFYVADTGNRRVLGWQGLPEPGQPPSLILGQDSSLTGLENRGDQLNAASFRWAHDFAGTDDVLYVADAGNHRVLGWSPVPSEDKPANLVLGQPNFETGLELPYVPQGAQRLRFPYGITCDNKRLAVADTANNRVLIWDSLPVEGCFAEAQAVIGQPNFNANGENHWKAVTHSTLCWPYGLHLHRDLLVIADSGNNRVVIWKIG
ncbi:NHL repeat-containing protein [Candidatus Chlorohelix sp.]|uniref:NHL repeat-containing protein n=1 Tax=Candidatus Chlorohelix sp. TaxID=3139201 RepID=UPI003052CE2B